MTGSKQVHFARFLWAVLGLLVLACIVAWVTAFSAERWHTGVWAQTDGSYDLAFVEFTERGNVFDRENFDHLTEALIEREGTVVVVFVHGWKHNAREVDKNVESFRRYLRNLSQVPAIKRRIVGIYVGWPGLSVRWPGFQEATFWARKAVAEQVGKGGATEILLRLENATVSPERGNLFVLVGHSMGGGIVLSALNEVLLERVLNAGEANGCPRNGADQCEEEFPCVRADAFGHAIFLVNPAIEANEILQLKEAIAQRCFPRDQDKLLHVISTDADLATHIYFPWGQRLAMLAWEEMTDLRRTYRGEPTTMSEKHLDRTTVGNFAQFRTGAITKYPDQEGWQYCSHAAANFHECELPPDIARVPENLVPTRTYEPVSFIYTGQGFMAEHNDIFNERVAAYLMSAAMESVARRRVGSAFEDLEGCGSQGWFDFGLCFESLHTAFGELDWTS